MRRIELFGEPEALAPGAPGAGTARRVVASGSSGPPRAGFTLFELILAIALSATLLALIGTAINLYLTQVDASRMRVEEAQLARSILAMIADDIRATSIYQPQDMSSIESLMASGQEFDVDSIDEPRSNSSSGSGSDSSSGTPSSSGGSGSSGSPSGSGGTSSGSDSSSGGTSSFGGVASPEEEGVLPLGVNGSLTEVYIDSNRLPRRDELFSTITGYTNAPLPAEPGAMTIGTSTMLPSGIVPPSDLKTVRYFVRQGEEVDAGSVAATSLDPASQQQAGGLVRQEIPRSLRVFAERSGNSAVLESGQSLVAPEVVNIEFRYYDGSQVLDVWDMTEQRTLPFAVEVRIWLVTPDAQNPAISYYDVAERIANARQYRQTVYLPMSELSAAAAMGMGGAGDSSSSSSTAETGSSFDSSSPSNGSESSLP